MSKKYAVFILEGIILFLLIILYKKFIIAYAFIILHEFVHIFAAEIYNVKVESINFNITGVRCSFSKFDSIDENKKIILYMAGPVFNLLSGVILLIINIFNGNSMESITYQMVLINLSLFIFNMIPAYPLDGARIYEALLLKRISYKKARKILEVISFSVSAIFALLFIISAYIHKINFCLLIATILIIYATISERRKTTYILLNDILLKKININKNKFLENKTFSVSDQCTLCKALTFLDKNKINYLYIVDGELNIKKIINEAELINAVTMYGNITFDQYIIDNHKETILKT